MRTRIRGSRGERGSSPRVPLTRNGDGGRLQSCNHPRTQAQRQYECRSSASSVSRVAASVVIQGAPEQIIRVCGELIRGRYYPQIAPRKGDASPLLNGPGDSETIGVAKRTATKSAKSA